MLRILSAFALWAACAASAQADVFAFQAGQNDFFAAPAETASPSATLTSLLAPSPVQGFDLTAGLNGGSADRNVAHTFAGLPAGILAATLEMRVRGGNNLLVNNDGVFLAFADATTPTLLDAIEFKRTFGPFAGGGTVFSDPDTGLAQSTTWSNGDTALLLLDLGALPLAGGGMLDLLPMLNAKGFLDVVVADETAADFFLLTVTTIPEPGSLALLLAGLGMLGLAARRRGA